MFFRRVRTQTTRSLLVDGTLSTIIIPERIFWRTRLFSIALFFLGLLFLIYPLTQSANSSFFYPETCLGDWEHPSYAAGRPDGIGTYGEGAAVLSSPNAGLFCSSFTGEIVEGALISSAVLRFSLHIGALSAENATRPSEAEDSLGGSDEATSDEADNLQDVPADDVTEGTTDDSVDETVTSGEAPADNLLLKDVAGGEESEPEAEQSLNGLNGEQENVPPEDASGSEETSLRSTFFALVPRAHAEEVEISEERGAPLQDVLRVRYTLDGTTWKDLGIIQHTDGEDVSFQIPLTEWSDIELLQVLVQGIENDEVVPVYLDAIGLVVSYTSNTDDELFEQPLLLNVPSVPMRQSDRELLLDPLATHACEVSGFSVTASLGTTTSASLLVSRSEAGSYEAEILGIPSGVWMTFKNGKTVYRIPDDVAEIPVTIAISDGAQRGDFSVVFLVTKKGKKDSAVVCQMNLLNP